ncbi:unnamed protein product [Rotaria sordida]|uniref:Uncharacterized protein n=2 Tax=Rotaria sordida TaxID=392033 RepID=A0A814Q6V2_9BILA|nr:unnamed protein product [Rotaria sordida]
MTASATSTTTSASLWTGGTTTETTIASNSFKKEKTNCVIGEAYACGRTDFDVTSSDCLVVDEVIELDDVDD